MFDTLSRVEQLRTERGLSLMALCEICRLPYSTIANARRRCGQLRIDSCELIASGLGLTLAEFFTEEAK